MIPSRLLPRLHAFAFVTLAFLLVAGLGRADADSPLSFSVLSIRGTVQYKPPGSSSWTRAHERMPLRAGDSIRTLENSSCIIRISRDNHAFLGSSTTVVVGAADRRTVISSTQRFAGIFPGRDQVEQITLIQLSGVVHSINHRVRASSGYRLVTPVAVTAVRGTEWFSAFGAGQVQPVDRFTVEMTPVTGGGPLVNLQFLGTDNQPVGNLRVGIPPAGQTGATGFRIDASGRIYVVDGAPQHVDGIVGVSQGEVEAVTIQRPEDIVARIRSGQTWTYQVPFDAFTRAAGLDGTVNAALLGGPGGPGGPGAPGSPAGPMHQQLGEVTHAIQDIQSGGFQRLSDRGGEQNRTAIYDLSNYSIGNYSTLSSSLSSFLSGAVTYSMLDSSHPINGGAVSWIIFSPADILQIKNSISSP